LTFIFLVVTVELGENVLTGDVGACRRTKYSSLAASHCRMFIQLHSLNYFSLFIAGIT